MFLYNITYNVESAIADEWILWQKEFHIKAILKAGYFYAYHFYELLEQDNTEGKTFVIQFLAKSKFDYDEYVLNDSVKLKNEEIKKWRNRYVSFSTLMNKI